MAAGKRFSAGRVFLEVIPSFKNLQDDIQSQVGKANKGLAKQQEELGKEQATARARGEEQVERAEHQKRKTRAGKQAAEVAEEQGRHLDPVLKRLRAQENRSNEERLNDQRKYAQMMTRERAKESRRSLEQFQRTSQAMVNARVKEGERQAREAERQAKDDRDRDARHAEFRVKSALQESKRLADAKEKQERADRERTTNHMAWIIKTTLEESKRLAAIEEKARADQARAEDRQAKKDEAARAKIRQRRASERLADMRRGDTVRRTTAGGAQGSTIRKVTREAADAIGIMKLDVDSSQARVEIAALREELLRINKGVGIDIDTADATARIKVISARLDKLRTESPEVDIEINSALAMAKLRAVEQQVDQINRKKVTGGLLSAGVSGGADQGANSFRIFSFAILGVVAILPAVPALAATAAAAIASIGTAAIGAGAGLGVMLLGFSGIGDAVSALGEVQDGAKKRADDTAKTMRTAGKSVRDAQQGLARAQRDAGRSAEDSARRISDARRSAARTERDAANSIKSALKSQQDAEKRLATAQRDATKAQVDLADARKQAQQDQQDLADKIAGGRLDERQALIDLFNAQVEYNAAMADGGSTNLEKEQASIQLERARLAIKGVRKENKDLAAEQKKGIDQNPAIVAAQEKLASAKENVKSAQEGVNDAELNTADARERAAERIADAQQSVADAVRDQAQSQVDSGDRVRDAQERLTDAQAAYQEALTKTGDVGDAAMQKLELAMGKLSPAGRAFAKFLFGLQPFFKELRDAAQEGMLPGVQSALSGLIDEYGPRMKVFVSDMAKAIGDFAMEFGKAMRTPAMQAFFDTMAEYAPTFFKQFGRLGIAFIRIVGGITKAFAPFAKEFMDGFVGMANGWADWAEGLDKNPAFQEFLDYVRAEGPTVLGLIGDLLKLVLNIGKGLAQNGMFDSLAKMVKWLAELDPGVIAAIVTAILSLVAASQIAAGLNALAITLAFIATSTVGLWVVAIAAVVLGFIALYENSEAVRGTVDKVWAFVRGYIEGFVNWMQTVLIPWFLNEALPVILSVWNDIADGAKWVWENILKPTFQRIGEAWGIMARIIVAFWQNLLWPTIKAIGVVIGWLYTKWVKPILGYIGEAFKLAFQAVGWAWDNVLKPIFTAIAQMLEGDFVGAWSSAVDAIKGIWDGLKRIVSVPMNFLIGTVLNDGLFKAFDEVMKFFGSDVRAPKLKLITYNDNDSKTGATPLAFAGSKRKNERQVGFSQGGYTGAGGMNDVAGVVHRGEVVWSQADVRRWGGAERVDSMRRAPGYALGGMVRPVPQSPRFPWGRYPSGARHPALDLPSPIGTPVHAPYPARVIRDGWDSTGYGTSVRTQNQGGGAGTFTIFGHLMKELVSVGQQISAGQVIGYTGNTGNSSGPHLHLEFRTSPFSQSSAFDFTSAFNGGSSAFNGAKAIAGAALAKPADLPWWADKPLQFLQDTTTSLVSKIPLPGMFGNILTGLPTKIFGGMREFLSNIINGDPTDQITGSGGGGKDERFMWNGHAVPNNGTQMFDSGGYVQPGVTTLLNMTGKPEPVRTAEQEAANNRGGSGGALVGNLTMNVGDTATAHDAVDTLMYRLRRIDHGGKYATTGAF